jgi:hypothetical protein
MTGGDKRDFERHGSSSANCEAVPLQFVYLSGPARSCSRIVAESQLQIMAEKPSNIGSFRATSTLPKAIPNSEIPDRALVVYATKSRSTR